jgi:hypothetical protein
VLSVLSAEGGAFFVTIYDGTGTSAHLAVLSWDEARASPFASHRTMFKTQTKTDIIKRFICDAGSSIISVEFVKADGTIRKLQFNPRDTQEVKGTGHALKKPNIVRCRDFAVARKEGEGAWRSFDCERVVKIQAHGTVISF